MINKTREELLATIRDLEIQELDAQISELKRKPFDEYVSKLPLILELTVRMQKLKAVK